MPKECFLFKRPWKEIFSILFLGLVFLLNTTFVFAEKEASGVLPEKPVQRMAKRILTLPFREDVVYEVRVGYGVTIELELPEEVHDIVNGDERLVAADYLGEKTYLKGIAYSAGESTSLHINTIPGRTLHLWARLVEPGESDFAFKFAHPSTQVFSESHVQKEMAKEKEKLEGEIEKREANLEEAAEKLAHEKLKESLLQEETVLRKGKTKEEDLEIRKLEAIRVGTRLYVKLILRNRSKADFPVGQILLSRALQDPKDSGKILGYEEIPMEEPTLEARVIREGEEVKALLSFNEQALSPKDSLLLRVIEEGGLGRVAEFRKVSLK